MKLQSKVILITAITWIVICVVIIADSKLTVSRDFTRLENELIKHDIDNTQKAYDRMLYTLVLYSQAFSQWDDAYDFMINKNQKFIDSNFVPGTFSSSMINFMMYYDTNQKLYYGSAFNLDKNSFISLPISLIQYIKENPRFLSYKGEVTNQVGVLNTQDGLIVMSSLPILTSTGNGPARGSLLMGYYLTDTFFDKLSEIVGLKLKFYNLSSLSKDPLIHSEFNKLNGSKKNSHVAINSKIAYGFMLLTDINNKPVGILRIEIPRYVYLQGISTSYHYISIVVILALLIMILTWYLLKIFVIDRVINISDQVTHINLNNPFKNIITVSGNDELGTMINSINNMIKIISYSQKRLLFMATHDDLTGLPNRKFFYDLLSQEINKAEENKTKIAVLFLDIDKFKKVNDQYGHDIGDKLIKYATQRIKSCIRKSDILARQSGDEFILCLKNIVQQEDILNIVNKIIKSTSSTYNINNLKISITFSIGISVYPDNGSTVEELLKKADQMMYCVKNNSGNNYKFYSNDSVLES